MNTKGVVFDIIGTCFSPDVYTLAKQDVEGDVCMVAAHAWDIAGAACAGKANCFH